MFYRGFEQERLKFITTDPTYVEHLSKIAATTSFLAADDPAPAPAPSGDQSIKKYSTFNETGNIMVVTTDPDSANMPTAVTEVFQKVIVFFAAWTKAISDAGYDLYDYDAIQALIGKSGFFVSMHLEDRTFDYSSSSWTLNTTIISDALGGVGSEGGALQIAQRVISSLGGQLQANNSDINSTKKVAHLLFVCENLMGMPIVNISLFDTTAKETVSISNTNCSSSISTHINFAYHQQDYMFVDPAYIDKMSGVFVDDPAFDKLVAQLKTYLPPKP